MSKLGFIGGGNMATALIGGLRTRQPDTEFFVIEPYESTRAALLEKFGITAQAEVHAGLAACDAILLAVKPQQMRVAAEALAPFAAERLIISIAAGIRSSDLMRWLRNGHADHAAIVRCMPNTPALIGAGMTGLYATPAVTEEQKKLAASLLASVGEILWLNDEAELDAVTALSGSGPAYVFYFIEAMQRAAAELGLNQAAARQLSLSTFLGAARLAAQSDEPVSLLRERVTSKGGTTYAALSSMDTAKVSDDIVRAIHAAASRSKELGDELGRA